jgi:hypothetical protein
LGTKIRDRIAALWTLADDPAAAPQEAANARKAAHDLEARYAEELADAIDQEPEPAPGWVRDIPDAYAADFMSRDLNGGRGADPWLVPVGARGSTFLVVGPYWCPACDQGRAVNLCQKCGGLTVPVRSLIAADRPQLAPG